MSVSRLSTLLIQHQIHTVTSITKWDYLSPLSSAKAASGETSLFRGSILFLYFALHSSSSCYKETSWWQVCEVLNCWTLLFCLLNVGPTLNDEVLLSILQLLRFAGAAYMGWHGWYTPLKTDASLFISKAFCLLLIFKRVGKGIFTSLRLLRNGWAKDYKQFFSYVNNSNFWYRNPTAVLQSQITFPNVKMWKGKSTAGKKEEKDS